MKHMKSWANRLACSAGMAACVMGSAMAQEGKLPMGALPEVIRMGETSQVNVFAAFANTMYAFAGAEFDIGAVAGAGAGVWSFASDGVIFGDQVWGIDVGQAHAPQIGVLADPANPLRVWNGRYTATSAVPALVELRAFPSSFDVYPSKQTSSSVPCEMEGGNAFIMVNPLSVGQWAAVPGRGTEARVHDDVWVDGQIITGENPSAAILMALLLPAIQSAPEGGGEGVRVAFDGLPTQLTHQVQVSRGQGKPSLSVDIGITKIEDNNQPTGFVLSGSESGTKRAEVQGFLGGVYVASGDMNHTGERGQPRLVVERVPDEIHVRVGPHVKVFGGGNESELIWTLVYDKPVQVQMGNSDWRNYRVSVDTIEVRKPVREPGSVKNINNLKQIGLGMHVFEAKGVRNMRLGPVQPE